MKYFITLDVRTHCVIILFVAVLSGCTNQTSDQGDGTPGSLDYRNNYIFYVTKRSDHPQVQFPSDSLPESQYLPDSSGKYYSVRFSLDGQQIFLKNDSIGGMKDSETGIMSKYNLQHGVFAGGRFIIWRNVQPLKSELTLYGSGVPILWSERGFLAKKGN
jgi:hypothetical protein